MLLASSRRNTIRHPFAVAAAANVSGDRAGRPRPPGCYVLVAANASEGRHAVPLTGAAALHRSPEEAARTVRVDEHWAIGPMLPELPRRDGERFRGTEYSSADALIELDRLEEEFRFVQEVGPAAQLDGRMVDRPVVLQARRTLQRAGT